MAEDDWNGHLDQILIERGFRIIRVAELPEARGVLAGTIGEGRAGLRMRGGLRETFHNLLSRLNITDRISAQLLFPYRDPVAGGDVLIFDITEWPSCAEAQAVLSRFLQSRELTHVVRTELMTQRRPSLGIIFMALEAQHLLNQGADINVRAVMQGYRRALSSVDRALTVAQVSRQPQDIPQLLEVLKVFHGRASEFGLFQDCQGGANKMMSSFFIRGCGDCNANTLLILSFLSDLNIRPPNGYGFGMVGYEDHVAPVAVNLGTRHMVNMYTFRYRPAGPLPIVDTAYLLSEAILHTSLARLRGESGLTVARGQFLHRPPETRFGVVFANPIFHPERLPQGPECFVPNCEPPAPRSRHPRPRVLAEDNRAIDEGDERRSALDDDETCPFIMATTLQVSLQMTDERVGYTSKRVLVEGLVQPGLRVISPNPQILNPTTALICSDTDSTRIEYNSERISANQSPLDLWDSLFRRGSGGLNGDVFEMIDPRYDNQRRRDPLDQESRNRRRTREPRVQLAASKEIWTDLPPPERLTDLIQGEARMLPQLVVSRRQCPNERVTDAFELCNLARQGQTETAQRWSRHVYPVIVRILRGGDAWGDFQNRRSEWRELKARLDQTHVELFNRARSHVKVLQALQDVGVDLERLLQAALEFRSRQGRDPLSFFISFSEAQPEVQIEFIEALTAISSHLEFLARVARDSELTVEWRLPSYGGHLLEAQLRYLLRNLEFKFIAGDLATLPEQLQRLRQDSNLRRRLRPGSSVAVDLPRIPRPPGWEEACRHSKTGYIESGSMVWQCPEPELSITDVDTRREIPVSPLLLPLMIAANERESLRPLNLLHATYLWRPTNDEAIRGHGQNSLIGGMFPSGAAAHETVLDDVAPWMGWWSVRDARLFLPALKLTRAAFTDLCRNGCDLNRLRQIYAGDKQFQAPFSREPEWLSSSLDRVAWADIIRQFAERDGEIRSQFDPSNLVTASDFSGERIEHPTLVEAGFSPLNASQRILRTSNLFQRYRGFRPRELNRLAVLNENGHQSETSGAWTSGPRARFLLENVLRTRPASDTDLVLYDAIVALPTVHNRYGEPVQSSRRVVVEEAADGSVFIFGLSLLPRVRTALLEVPSR